MSGFVYFIREQGEPGYIKIGASDSPIHRLRQLQSGNPRELHLVVAVEVRANFRERTTREWHRHEAAYHRNFAYYRVHGEWFKPAVPILQEIDILLSESQPWIAPGANGARVVLLNADPQQIGYGLKTGALT